MTEKDLGEKPVRSGWVIFGFLVTVIYFAALGFVLGNSGPDSLFPINKNNLALNTFGDFVAGICAPLAFLWLFVATMVQSQELALQRQELRLTRREFELNREIAKQQAKEAHAQATFIGAQTKILQSAEVDRLIETHQATFVRRYRDLGGRTMTVGEENDKDKLEIHIGARRALQPPLNFVEAGKELLIIATQLQRFRKKFADKAVHFSRARLQPVGEALSEISDILAGSSPTMLAKLEEANFATTMAAADYLIAQCKDEENTG